MNKQLTPQAGEMLVQLSSIVQDAAAHWQAYWAFDAVSSHKEFGGVFRDHSWWYVLTREVYFLGAVIALGKYFEKNDHSVNIWNFIAELDPEFWSAEIKFITLELENLKSPIRDIAIMRSNFYAHRNRDLTQQQIFNKTSLCYDDIPATILRMELMLNEVISVLGGSKVNVEAVSKHTETEITALLNKLKQSQ